MTAIIERGEFALIRHEFAEAAEPIVLTPSEAFGIQLPNASLYRDQHAHLMDPGGTRPTVWFTEEAAESHRGLVAVEMELWYGCTEDELSRMRVVRLERDVNGEWALPEVCSDAWAGYRPVDPDTGELAEIPCASRAELDLETAHRAMRQHRVCAGQITCKVRGRGRALLAREGMWTLRGGNVWHTLDMPDMARWGTERIGGRALVHLAGVA